MGNNDFILTIPVKHKPGSNLIMGISVETLIEKHRDVVLEALMCLKQEIAYLAQEHLTAANSEALYLEIGEDHMNLNYTKDDQETIDELISAVQQESISVDTIANALFWLKKAVAISAITKIRKNPTEDINTELTFIYAL